MAVDLERIRSRMERLGRDMAPAVTPDDPYMVDAKAFLTQAEVMVKKQIQVVVGSGDAPKPEAAKAKGKK